MSLIAAGTVALEHGLCRPGWVETSNGRIAGCGSGLPPRPADADMPEALLVPGFVDIHAHGGGGASYTDGNDADILRAALFHRRHGTTTAIASIVTTSPGDLRRAMRVLADSTRAGVVAGIHLEGPWLSVARCGAHDPRQLRDPELAEIDSLLTVGGNAIRMVTLAPERRGSDNAISHFVAAGVVVAVGHTDATYEQTRHAIELGATVGTHLFNAMRPVHHREPGPALALLEDGRVVVELIADGIHVHPAMQRAVIAAAGADRVALVTDATAAAGLGDGEFRLGTVQIEVVGNAARVRGTSTIAGSTATMDQLFRAAAGLGADRDAALAAAVQMTSTTPARALGLGDVGSLRVGADANLVVLNQDLRVIGVMAAGEWVGSG
ncbi:MAG: N-acetylglucosamine-6-phosphate deacetylase [Mycobacterium sp.]|uniref:N-acetylglucosamine-6-phosphate deacetylase n=1 Tax=Mycobacterium sp. TaxID=1785 RepID=UPI003C33A25E